MSLLVGDTFDLSLFPMDAAFALKMLAAEEVREADVRLADGEVSRVWRYARLLIWV